MAHVINLTEKLASFERHWQPRVVGGFNGPQTRAIQRLPHHGGRFRKTWED